MIRLVFLVGSIIACTTQEKVFIPLKTVSYKCLQTETKLKKCIFTECIHSKDQTVERKRVFRPKTNILKSTIFDRLPKNSGKSECEETHCLIEQSGSLMGTPACRRYALEQLSENNRRPIINWLQELENERLSYIDEVTTE